MRFRLYFVRYKEVQRGVLREEDKASEIGEADDVFTARKLAIAMRERNSVGVCYCFNGDNWYRYYWFKNSSINRVRSNLVDTKHVPKQIRALELLQE